MKKPYKLALVITSIFVGGCGGGGGGNAASSPPAITPPAVTYSVSGTISGLTGSGLVLQLNGANNTSRSTNGVFAFTNSITDGSSYSISILTQPSSPAQTCSVNNGSGTISGGNVTNVAVNCIDGLFTATGTMSYPRLSNTGVTLLNGKVLVAGGVSGNAPVASAELYDPTSATWATTGNMASPRYSHTATLLPDGKVLVAGGQVFIGTTYASAELFDPATGNWTSTGSMSTGRSGHTATLLANGKVLVTGGVTSGSSGVLNSISELYDPTSGTWAATGSMLTGRMDHTATLLADGKILVTGGTATVSIASAELYDSTTGIWTATGNMTSTRRLHTATLLANGKVLVAGGETLNFQSETFLNTAELYDPTTGSFVSTGNLTTERIKHGSILLSDGMVLVAGGIGIGPPRAVMASAELYNPTTGAWSKIVDMPIANEGFSANLLPNGAVLISAGFGDAEIFRH